MGDLIKPSQLPRIRRDLLASLDSVLASGATLRATRQERHVLDMTRVTAERLVYADLYLASPDMTRMAVDGARDVPPTPLPQAWPGEVEVGGIMAFSGGLPPVTLELAAHPDVEVTPSVLTWCRTADVALLGLWSEAAGLARAGVGLSDAKGGWWPVCTAEVHDLDEPVDMDAFSRPDSVRAVSLALSTWVQMQTPTMADVTDREEAGPKVGSGKRRDVSRTVRVVELRRLARQPAEPREPLDPDEPLDDGGPKREYHHQWVVRGHWRQQPYGPERAQRRTTWIPPYVKGPEGAPLLGAETVFVWRR